MPKGVLHQIGEHLRQQFPIAMDQAFSTPEGLCRQRHSVIFGDVGIDVSDGFDDTLEVQIDEPRLARASLDLRDA